MKKAMFLVWLLLFFPACVQEPGTQEANVYGHALAGESQLYVPNASIEVVCAQTGGSYLGQTDDLGFYSINLSCPSGSGINVLSDSGPVEICLRPGACQHFAGGRGNVSGIISGEGYALVNIRLV